jgi:hypothetical protein
VIGAPKEIAMAGKMLISWGNSAGAETFPDAPAHKIARPQAVKGVS